MAKPFKIPFALSGDKAPVPDALQPDGSVSYTQGFGPDYELDKTVDPINAKDVPRDQSNQIYFDVTQAIGEIQSQGFASWYSELAPYALNAEVFHSGRAWRSNVASNASTPGTDANWTDVSVAVRDTLDTVRINVASAANINLTVAAPDTRHINITGTTAINGFTVEAGRCYFVRFADVLTLTNSASLVTQSGANITTAAGDTCVIRATAANVVEIMFFTTRVQQGLGYNQTWQDMTASRVVATNYTNSAGRAIAIQVNGTSSATAGVAVNILVNGVAVAKFGGYGGGVQAASFCIIPPGAVYRVEVSNFTMSSWLELR